MDNELLTFGLLVFTSYITLINPLSVMPVFMTMTADLSQRQRNRTALKANLVAFLALIIFAFSGQLIFNFFGISINSLRIVGGIIFFLMGQDMLQARLTSAKFDKEEEENAYASDISITPLAIPMICGPGAITNAIVLMEDAKTPEMIGILLGVIGVVCLISYIVLVASSQITKLLGETGNKVMLRIMGLIIMVIAVEFFLTGLRPYLESITK
jgi:multiple antibiotic resistance protein